MKNKNIQKSKYIFMSIGIILIIFAGVISYLVINDLRQENILKQEIINLSNKDLLTDNYDIKIKTSGDYGYIEEAIKNYYKQLSNSIKIINNYLTDEDLIQILSATNLKNDGPNFNSTHKVLTETRKKTNDAMTTIINLCNEETIKKLINKDKIDNYYYELYLNLMYTKDDLKELITTKNEMQTISDNLNVFLDKVEAMIKVLEANSDYWFIEDNQLYFEKTSLVTEYNNLYNDLNEFVSEKFSNQKSSNKVDSTNTNV